MSNFLNKAAILAAQDIKPEIVEVPEWGGKVGVKRMTGAEFESWQNWVNANIKNDANGNPDTTKVRPAFLAHLLVDDAGKKLFEEADIVELGKKSIAPLMRLFGIAQRINGLVEDSVETAKKP